MCNDIIPMEEGSEGMHTSQKRKPTSDVPEKDRCIGLMEGYNLAENHAAK